MGLLPSPLSPSCLAISRTISLQLGLSYLSTIKHATDDDVALPLLLLLDAGELEDAIIEVEVPTSRGQGDPGGLTIQVRWRAARQRSHPLTQHTRVAWG